MENSPPKNNLKVDLSTERYSVAEQTAWDRESVASYFTDVLGVSGILRPRILDSVKEDEGEAAPTRKPSGLISKAKVFFVSATDLSSEEREVLNKIIIAMKLHDSDWGLIEFGDREPSPFFANEIIVLGEAPKQIESGDVPLQEAQVSKIPAISEMLKDPQLKKQGWVKLQEVMKRIPAN